MAVDTEVRQAVLKELDGIRMDLIQCALGPAVRKSAEDDIYLKRDSMRQAQLQGLVRGLSIIYYFSFLQSHIETDQWKGIKDHCGSQRGQLPLVDWDAFDVFKYVRDCFGHSGRGQLFPPHHGNSKHFHSILKNGRNPNSVTVDGGAIHLEAAAGDDCFFMVCSVLEKGNIIP